MNSYDEICEHLDRYKFHAEVETIIETLHKMVAYGMLRERWLAANMGPPDRPAWCGRT